MSTQKAHIVVLGAGYAGLMAAMRVAAKTHAGQVDVTLVNASATFNERVRNHQLAAGQPVGERPLADFLRRTRIQFVEGEVSALYPAQRRVQVQTGPGQRWLDYDYLVYALGSYIRREPVPGVREHTYSLDYGSAQQLAQALPPVAARQGRVLIVGGGNTGVEVATELAERYPGLRVTLATRHAFARQLSEPARRHIRRAFQRLGVTFLEHTEVVSLRAGQAAARDGRPLPFDLCVWVGGFGVSDLARRAGVCVNDRNQIIIDRAMRSLSHPEIYAVGDAALPAEVPGAPVRMSLYSAIMMGAHGADCLANALNGRPLMAFGLSYMALGVSLGRRDGVAQFLDWDTDVPLNLIIKGRVANVVREFFVRFAVWAIQVQRVAPWVFDWPGKRKQRHVPVQRPVMGVAEPAALSIAER